MSIIDTYKILVELRKRYLGIEIKDYAFRKLYSTEHMVFFDCDEVPQNCLNNALTRVDYPRFIAYAVVEDAPGHRYVMEVSYTNLGKETLEKFAKRYLSS